jgi:hypothetical protein
MAMDLITTNTSSGAASSDFTSSIDSTYKLYIFKFYDVNPATDGTHFQFQANASGQTGYNETMTTTLFSAYQDESGTDPSLWYNTDDDQAQGTAYQIICRQIGNGSDESGAGELFLFNPASTTYVKHFYSRANNTRSDDYCWGDFCAGYINTTSAIDDIQFKMASGNMDGTIKMYGVG